MTARTGQGIQEVEMPYMPEYASLDARLRSFRNWNYGHVQDAKRLAEAGFYYAGVEDEVRCFHCDGGLRDWLVTDDPWHEHARCFAGCNFLQLVLGETYISQVLLNGAAVIANNIEGASASAQQGSYIGNASTMLSGGTNPQQGQQQQHAAGCTHDVSNELTHRLREENNRLKEERECKICLTREVGVVFCPCGHLVSCVQCAPAIYNCPVCRALITGRIRTYLS